MSFINLLQKRITILLIFTFILFTTAFSQNDFRQGYYITLDNDTVFGLLDYRGEIRNSNFCVFQKNKDSEPVQFEPSEIQAYRFNTSKFYVSKKINVNGTEKQVFAEYLVDGIINLYFYRNLNNYMYLIEGEDGQLIELTNEKEIKYIEGRGKVEINSYKYIGLLKARLADCKEIQDKIENVGLEHGPLINLIKEYHNYVCDDEECIIYEKQVPKVKLHIAPVIGGGISNLHFDKGPFSKFKFDQNYFPLAGILFNIIIPNFSEKISIDIEADINKFDIHGFYVNKSSFITEYYNAYFNIISLQPSVALKYTFPKGQIKPTLAIGLYSNFFISKDEKVIKRSVHSDAEYSYEFYETPLSTAVNGMHIQIGFNYQILNEHTFFTNLRICKTLFKEAGISTFLNSANLSIGMNITKDN